MFKWNTIKVNKGCGEIEQFKGMKGVELKEFLAEAKEVNVFENTFMMELLGNIANQKTTGNTMWASIKQVEIIHNAIEKEKNKVTGVELDTFLKEAKDAGIFSNPFYVKVLGNIAKQKTNGIMWASKNQLELFSRAIEQELEKGKAGKKFLELI